MSVEMIKENWWIEKGFRDVFMSDDLPKKIEEFENGIIILHTSTGSGTHWVSYFFFPVAGP